MVCLAAEAPGDGAGVGGHGTILGAEGRWAKPE